MGAAFEILLASLLGSPHCGAMCGPFVAFYTGSADPGTAGSQSHAAYSLGRLTAYIALGAIAGALGAGVDRVGALAGIGRLAATAAGVLMVVWGVSTILAWRGVRVAWLHVPVASRAPVTAAMTRIRRWPPLARAGATGLATALLPCGWLYVFVAVAAGTGSASRGALTMTVFWIGTLPLMLAMGLGLQRLFGAWRARLPVVTASAIVVLGLLTIAGRLRAPAPPPVAGPHAAHHGTR